MRKQVELKYADYGQENNQLYHNLGASATNLRGIIFDPWVLPAKGDNRDQRNGDEIIPIGMRLKLWLANKSDRPNLLYRVIVAVIPRVYGNTITTIDNINIFSPLTFGTNGNNMMSVLDKEKGIKTLYDRIFRVEGGMSAVYGAGTWANKEYHKPVNIFIQRKKSRKIKFDNNNPNHIINNPLGVYVIPYDSYGTLTTDNVASCAWWFRLMYRDP